MNRIEYPTRRRMSHSRKVGAFLTICGVLWLLAYCAA
jgi:hypothetical protein